MLLWMQLGFNTDNWTPAEGRELWKYDGTVCKMVADLNPGTGDGAGFSNMLPYQGGLLFNGDNGITGKELYRVQDNTAAGIQNLSWNGNVSIYPNPATTSVTFKLELQTREFICIYLVNAAGQEVYNSGLQQFNTGAQTKEIPLQSLVPGQYFYRLSSQSGQLLASGAIVKQ